MKAAQLPHIAYHHINRSANQVTDDMVRRALEAKSSVIYWGGQVQDGAPANQVDEVYHQQEDVPQLKPNLPKPLDWMVVPTVAACFGAEWGRWVMAVRAAVCQQEALQLREDVEDYFGLPPGSQDDLASLRLANKQVSVVAAVSWQPVEDPPLACRHCGKDHDQPSMVLCDRCNVGYHVDCMLHIWGSMLHDGLWFCGKCKGWLALNGHQDVTQDFALIDHLWAGYLPKDADKYERIRGLAEVYRAYGRELQVEVLGKLDGAPHWVNVPPLVTRVQLVADTHNALGHCGREKLLKALRAHHWWPGMYLDADDCVRHCSVYQKDRPAPKIQEDLRWIDKG